MAIAMAVVREAPALSGNYDWVPLSRQKIASLVGEAHALERYAIEKRRQFHRLAEPGWLEFQTTECIVKELSAQGYDILEGAGFVNPVNALGIPDLDQKGPESQNIPGSTGCLAMATLQRPGPTVALRFDIDALPIEEADSPHRPSLEGWRSNTPNVMHACGHDAHIAIGLCLARVLNPLLAKGRGRLKLIFQPAEEGGRGARSIVEYGHLDDVDLFLSCHIGMGLSSGTVATNVSGFQATQKYRAMLRGHPAHAGKEPEKGRNALLSAALGAISLHTLNQHSEYGVRVNVGILESGRASNIVPDLAKIAFEIRANSQDTLRSLSERSLDVLKGAAQAYGTELDIKLTGESFSVVTDVMIAEHAEKLGREAGLFKTYVSDFAFNAAEDATTMIKAVQDRGGIGAYLVFGSDLTGPHHTATFDIDESILTDAVSLLALLVASALDLG